MKLYLRLISESILMAWHALVVNKLRTFLSLLGIAIGIFAIISVFTAVDGLKAKVVSSVDQLGSNVIYVEKWPWTFGGDYPWWKYWQRPPAGYKEMDQLKERVNLAQDMCFCAYSDDQTFKNGSNTVENGMIEVVSHDYYRINKFDLSEGRYFTETESASGYPVAIVGADVAANLFPNLNALDKEIILRGHKARIIGVYAREGESILGNSHDAFVTIPVNYARRFLEIRSDKLNPRIMVKAKDGITNQELIDELRSAMRSIRRLRPVEDDSFALNETKLLSGQITSLFGVLTAAGWIIGGFSILVGGFGIANIMFVSVKERTPVIGIQKSLGAKNFFILIQFLTESIVLCLFGGLLGLTLVFILTLVAKFTMDMDFPLTFSNIFLGVGVSALIGIVSGFVPSFTASQLDPVEAIRSNG